MKQVLIVEDEPTLLKIFKMELEERGKIKVYTAESGTKALEVLESQKIDVILTDLTMPEMDGIKLLETIKENKIEIACKIIISGLPQEMYSKKIESLDVTKYFEKPFSIKDITSYLLANC